ncbi:TatD family hydrolase [Desulfobaculum bizertense]|uniref:TatD DNase family protein n=1 Tax=Desulfobaculum bizertense DSM 18034 TaxID=1121442 RepID=A0A1T4VJT7_9BACT|nr:TatD family hydrolase [Desulfobaculum bizertense]UIJ37937.1 TatD family hydrolase [Desulfobaculum bizertense]SKA64831.1 TatD DNase family protein [Desulfobaculum bizertense DSM 18034]
MSRKKNRPLPESLQLPAGGVETHAHLDPEHFEGEIDAVVEHARQCGISHIGNVFLSPERFEETLPLYEKHPEIFYILGIHPQDAKDYTDERLEHMRRLFLANPRIKALGEIGLDYFYELSPREIQFHAFRKQLQLARELDKPVVIHSRDAHEDSLRILIEEGFDQRPLLWHCFNADRALAEEILSHGWYVSIPGPVTYKKNVEFQDAIQYIPLDRIVVETDSPYLTPEPYRGKRNEPALVCFTANKVAELLGIDPAEFWLKAGQNARTFFGL